MVMDTGEHQMEEMHGAGYAKLLHPWLNLLLSILFFWIQILAAYFLYFSF